MRVKKNTLALLAVLLIASSLASAQPLSGLLGLFENDPVMRLYAAGAFILIVAAEFYLLGYFLRQEKMERKASFVCFNCGYTANSTCAFKSDICPDCKRKTTWIEIDA
jgi:lipopolysaccharide biosynthesis regulator YciM